MEQDSKYLEKIFDLHGELFCQDDIDVINEKMDKNLPILFANEKYGAIDDKVIALTDKLEKLLNEEQLKIFKKISFLEMDEASYQNCLAYYLGVKAGLKINRLE